jgi:hypothetical protein
MKRDIAAAIALEKLDAAAGQQFGRRDYVCRVCIAAKGDDRRVFEQEQNIADLFFFTQGNELLLQEEASGVVDGAELDDGDQRFAFFLTTACLVFRRSAKSSFIFMPQFSSLREFCFFSSPPFALGHQQTLRNNSVVLNATSPRYAVMIARQSLAWLSRPR